MEGKVHNFKHNYHPPLVYAYITPKQSKYNMLFVGVKLKVNTCNYLFHITNKIKNLQQNYI